jgi:hypothetical protein
MSSPASPATRLAAADTTALRILARTLVREFDKRGYGLPHIVALANELIDLACETVRSNRVSGPDLT